jgi:flagellar biosynthesis/type III secretory pathway protein FliH
VSTQIEAHLTQKWREADKLVQELKRENEQLKTQVAEFERRQQIAVRNAYADGFEAGKEDTFKLLRKHR